MPQILAAVSRWEVTASHGSGIEFAALKLSTIRIDR
jgi:hypothetical protein